jgi:ketosteroid isomerase-like protein
MPNVCHPPFLTATILVERDIKKGMEEMRRIYLAIPAILLIFGCQQKQDIQAETQNVEKALRDFFTAISEFNYQGLRDVCTSDYQLLEDGLVWNADSLIKAIKSFEGEAKIVYNFEDIKTKIIGQIAWMSYRNEAVMTNTKTGEADNLKWVESAVFEKDGNRWKMALLHSTSIKPNK